jgi:hypothetical protein
MSKFAAIEPKEQRDQRATGQKQLDEEIRTQFAKLLHTCSVRSSNGKNISPRSPVITTETAYRGGWKVHAVAWY